MNLTHSVRVRLYQPTDRDAVHGLAADTAFFGEPVETFLPDRQLFSDFFMAYYTDNEPEHLWVAEVEGKIAGYFAGSLTGSQLDAGLSAARRVIGGVVSRRYRDFGATVRFAQRMVAASLRGEYPPTPTDEYPAHLHINVDASYRGLGLGRQLMTAGLDGMTAAGAPGIHLHTTSYNRAAVALYEKMGFTLLGSRPTRLWEPWLPGVNIENCVYGRRLPA